MAKRTKKLIIRRFIVQEQTVELDPKLFNRMVEEREFGKWSANCESHTRPQFPNGYKLARVEVLEPLNKDIYAEARNQQIMDAEDLELLFGLDFWESEFDKNNWPEE